MKVIVYVEGPSDKSALPQLLTPVIETGRGNRIGIVFVDQGGKTALLDDVGRKAANHLDEHREDWVFALPDLYPMRVYDGTRNAHRSFEQLRAVLIGRFNAEADRIALPANLRQRFRVHCLKHDLEALLLAAPEVLRERLKTSDGLKGQWRLPVEDQDDQRPPKRVVEDLFKKYRKKPNYVDTLDAPWILQRASLEAVAVACPQRLRPLVEELRTVAQGAVLA